MPDHWAALDFLKNFRSGNRCVKQGKPAHLRRVSCGIRISNHQPDVMPYEENALMPELSYQLMNIFRQGPLVVSGSGLVGISRASQVGNDDGEIGRASC